jgi:O-antigen/teichoic acid export membrane protein
VEDAVVKPDLERAGETRLAVQNALKLGGSLVFTWGIALVMRFWLPRHLGPSRFGTLSFADAFAATFFIVLSLGIDPYIRKEISVRPAHASDFFGGTFVLRSAMSVLVVVAMMLSMIAMHRPPEARRVVYVFALAQFFVTMNATLSALLQANGSVGGMSLLAVATKVIWALGVLAAVKTGVGLPGVALAYLVSEAVETVVLFLLAQRHLRLVFRVDVGATRAVVLLSLPYYLNLFATTAYGKLDVTLLALAGSSREVGWYAAASAIASFSLLAAPLIGWVLMPTLARAAARSRDELFARLHRPTELILIVAIPAALFINLASDLGVGLLFGDAFAPAGLALRILAPTFVVTYVAIVFAITLVMLERVWTLTAISLAGLVVNVLLNLALVRPSMARFGDGGGGAGCALSMLGTEVFVTTVMVSFVGQGAFDRRTAFVVVKSLGACAVTLAADRFVAPVGWARLGLDAIVYVLFVVATGALRVGEIAATLRAALRDRSRPAPSA